MSYDCPDFVDDATDLLADAGYTFHNRESTEEDQGLCIGDTVHWFAWTDGKMDIECGEDCGDALVATIQALRHWMQNTRILSVEEESLLDAPEIADVLSEARTRIDEAFQDAEHLDDTEAWREAAKDTLDKIDAILTPIAEAA